MLIKKPFLHVAAALIWLAPTGLLAEDLTVTGYNQMLDLDCADKAVLVEGLNHGLNFTGPCDAMTVMGVENIVDFANARVIALSGSANRLQGALAGIAPATGADVTLSGSENMLTLRFERPGVVQISGSGNRLVWAVAPGIPKPEIRITGENNEVVSE